MTKPYLYLRDFNTRKKTAIYIGLRHTKSRPQYLRINTGIKIPVGLWDSKKQIIKSTGFPEIDLSPYLVGLVSEGDLVSGVNKFLSDALEFVDTNQILDFDVLKSSVQDFISGVDDTGSNYLMGVLGEVKRGLKGRATKDQVNNLIKQAQLKETETVTVVQYFTDYISKLSSGQKLSKGKRVDSKTVQAYRSTLDGLLEFLGTQGKSDVYFGEIDGGFMELYGSVMIRKRKWRPVTHGKHLARFKSVLKAAFTSGVHTNPIFQTNHFQVVTSKSQGIALTDEEIQSFIDVELTKFGRLDRVRDLFIILCHTGLRLSDAKRLTLENIVSDKSGDRFIQTVQEKTDNPVTTILTKDVDRILTKWDGCPNGISDQKFNKYLKELSEMVLDNSETVLQSYIQGGIPVNKRVPRWSLVSSHVGRRSFATNSFRKGIDPLTIRQITGHKDHRSFESYVKIDSLEFAQVFKKSLNLDKS